jgi:hypothetical protein
MLNALRRVSFCVVVVSAVLGGMSVAVSAATPAVGKPAPIDLNRASSAERGTLSW